MRPLLLEWRGVRLWSYPVLAYCGLTLGLVVQNWAANASQLDSLRVWLATLALLPFTLMGGRLLFVATHWDSYRRAPRRIWRRGEGGLAMYGGLPVMLLGSLPVLGWLGLPFWRFWDASTACVLVTMVFTRFGCLLTGCCAGRLSGGKLAVWLPDERGQWERRLPMQLFEIGWTLLLLLAVLLIWPARPFDGALFLGALAGYATGRLLLQPFRANHQRGAWIDLSVAISAALIVCCCAAWLLARP